MLTGGEFLAGRSLETGLEGGQTGSTTLDPEIMPTTEIRRDEDKFSARSGTA
jgi:hypothetical protein